jgi:hypothetical protein
MSLVAVSMVIRAAEYESRWDSGVETKPEAYEEVMGILRLGAFWMSDFPEWREPNPSGSCWFGVEGSPRTV